MEQSKVALKVPTSESSSIQVKITPVPDYAIPQKISGDDPRSRMVKRKLIQDVSREIPRYPDPFYRPLLNQQKYPYKKFPETYWILTQKLIWTSKKIHHFKRV